MTGRVRDPLGTYSAVFAAFMVVVLLGVIITEPTSSSAQEHHEESQVAYFSGDLYYFEDVLPVSYVEEQQGSYSVWDALADCESGNRARDGSVVEGSARWWYGDPSYEHPSWGLEMFHGGLQFLPATWSWVAPMVIDSPPHFAWQATKEQQILVAMRTQELQGWEAWPRCARKIGLLS